MKKYVHKERERERDFQLPFTGQHNSGFWVDLEQIVLSLRDRIGLVVVRNVEHLHWICSIKIDCGLEIRFDRLSLTGAQTRAK